MQRLNVIGVESIHGLRTIELVRGDIADIQCDLLAVSAFKGGYSATPGTVLGSLRQKHDFSLRDDFDRREYDLRDQFGIWVTRALEGMPFARVICVEMKGHSEDPAVAMENLFVGLAVLEAKGVKVATLALPFLGTGLQKIPTDQIVSPMISQTTAALHRLQFLERVTFAAIDPEMAGIISDEMDKQLGYTRTALPRLELASALLAELRAIAGEIRLLSSGVEQRMAEEMLDVVSREEPASTEIGLLARRLAEVITDVHHQGKPSVDLFQKIEGLAQRGISPWVVNYLHTLRVIGNEVVHIRDGLHRTPPQLADDDVALCLFCVLRVAHFWQDSIRSR
jgi:hypothetical protein